MTKAVPHYDADTNKKKLEQDGRSPFQSIVYTIQTEVTISVERKKEDACHARQNNL